ncbi:3-hydroxyacyl-CoA dehydrogenase family protein [Streptomyces kanamyceticus]|uniref:3-hydroxyacyl-CoA dehydrogenase family protein n=1 Tax=Streptomyces kanamyceticus TaxID=1967 RepID=UPI0006E3345E|nr:3-hydroxyacyl-CoA dehydrogenase family protein [Streptomyces kanamyceticus]
MSLGYSQVAVVGIGAVGSALVDLLARSGLPVIAVEADEAALSAGRRRVAERASDAERPGAVRWSASLADVADADLVIEALPERLDLKAEVIGKVRALCAPSTVFATTTTGLSVTELASRWGALARTVGLHLFPAGPLDVVEVITTPLTDGAVRKATEHFVASLGLDAVALPDRPGFIGGALTMAYLNSAVTMYEQRYASREDIDAAMTLGCGLPMGPLARLDAIGLDVAHDSLEALYTRTGDRQYAPAPLLSHYVAAGLFGRKSGRGLYDYSSERGSSAPAAHQGAAAARPVRTIGVVGSGTMGAGIAQVCARAGHPTVLVARSEAKAKGALLAVERSLGKAVTRGKLTSADMEATMGRLTGASQLEALDGCDLVVEAVVEELAVKRRLFAALGPLCRPDAVLASSTSSLPIIECATASGRPENVLGMHFFNPAPVMRLVEVVRTALTSDETVATAHTLATELGKQPVGCADRAGFIVNALLFPFLNQAIGMVEGHAVSPEDVDLVMTGGHGHPMGPLRLLDVVGLDVSLQIQRTLHQTFLEPSLAPAHYLEHLVGAGHLGRKTGVGFLNHARG